MYLFAERYFAFGLSIDPGDIGTVIVPAIAGPAAMDPAEGELRLTSAIRWRPGADRAPAMGRGDGAAQIRSAGRLLP